MKVYQVYFHPDQLSNLEEEFIPYDNSEKVTVFFESQVIRDLVMDGHADDCDYFGVVSHKLRAKLGYMKDNWRNNPNIANHSTTEFTPALFMEELYRHKPDAMSFQRHAGHDTVSLGDIFHPGFLTHWKKIMKYLGLEWKPEAYPNVFYCNFVIAKRDIYKDFVVNMLDPAMEFMKAMPELMENSRYPHPLPDHLKTKFGINHFPFHPFICERFFSYYAHIHKLNCKHY